jgi:hypothetical protein
MEPFLDEDELDLRLARAAMKTLCRIGRRTTNIDTRLLLLGKIHLILQAYTYVHSLSSGKS